MRIKDVTAAFLIAVIVIPSVAVAQGNGRGSARAQGIPPGHLPPPGECRVWIDGRPPGHQPPPTDCRSAEIAASRRRDARVVYGDRTDRRDDGAWRDDRRDGAWRDDERRPTRRAVPRRDDSRSYPPRDRRDHDHPGWINGYRDGQIKGREDVGKDRSYDPNRHQWYRSASRGYDTRYGIRGAYANIYREGFDAGYAEEFRVPGRARRS